MLDKLQAEALAVWGSEQRNEGKWLVSETLCLLAGIRCSGGALKPGVSLISVLETSGLALLKYRKPRFHIRLGLMFLTDTGNSVREAKLTFLFL